MLLAVLSVAKTIAITIVIRDRVPGRVCNGGTGARARRQTAPLRATVGIWQALRQISAKRCRPAARSAYGSQGEGVRVIDRVGTSSWSPPLQPERPGSVPSCRSESEVSRSIKRLLLGLRGCVSRAGRWRRAPPFPKMRACRTSRRDNPTRRS